MASDPAPDLLAVIRAMVAEINDVHTRAVEAIEAEPDADLRFNVRSELVANMSKLVELDAEGRRRDAGEIWRTESLSLAKLADRFGMSKTRAEQLIKKMREQEGKSDVE